jgi:hypothetical protein
VSAIDLSYRDDLKAVLTAVTKGIGDG